MKKTKMTIAVVAALAGPPSAGAAIYQFNANLRGANEVPSTISAASGVATLAYNDLGTLSFTDDVYSFSMSVFSLTGGVAASGFHIHGAATAAENAPVRVNLGVGPFVSLNVGGGTLLVGGSNVPVSTIPATVAPPSPNAGHPPMSFLAMLQSQLAYVNVHTPGAFSGGEIRGQLIEVTLVPEPEAYALMLAGLGLVGWVAARRRRNGV